MKKLCGICLLLALFLGLTACGKSTEAKWQEQYDLGMKYLSEGNYEEAVIAFAAAIQLEPKSADAYLALADVYEAQGDTESLQAILEQGLEATGDARFQEWLEEQNRTLPAPLNVYIGNEEFVEYTPELKAAFEPVVQAGISGNKDEIDDLLLAEDLLLYVKNMEGVTGFSEEGSIDEDWKFWTITDDDVLLRYHYIRINEVTALDLDYRPGDGDGFTYSSEEGSNYSNKTFVQGFFSGYLFNGAFTEWLDHVEEEYWYTEITEGNAVNEFLQGETKTSHEENNDSYRVSLEYCQYENGLVQAPWTDEEGRPCTRKLILKDGTEGFTAAESDGTFDPDWRFYPGGGMIDYLPEQN